jgi:hypothetical protein
MTIWNPVLDQRKGGSRREFTVTWDRSGIKTLKKDVPLQVVTLQGPGPRPRRVPGRYWLCPPLHRHSISLSSHIIILCPRALSTRRLLSTRRALRWLSPGPWLPVARASCWLAAAAWSRRRRRSGPAMATGPPWPSCLSALRQSVICEMLVCVCIACIILHSYPNYPTYLSQLSYILISIILHTYPNYPTYLVIYPTYPLHAYVADKQTR